MDAAKDSLEEAKDLAASLTGKALMMKQANAIANAQMKEEVTLLTSPEGLRLASFVDQCMIDLKHQLGSKAPKPKNIMKLATKCQPKILKLQNLTKTAMSPAVIAATYEKHTNYYKKAMVCLKEGRTMDDCSKSNVTSGLDSNSDINNNMKGDVDLDTIDSNKIHSNSTLDCCTNNTAKCLSCQSNMTIKQYCTENNVEGIILTGCSEEDINAHSLVYSDPGLKSMEKNANNEANELLRKDDDRPKLTTCFVEGRPPAATTV